MEMGDQYGLPDFQRLLTRRTHFPASLLPQPSDSPYLAHHRNMAPSPPPYHEPPYVLSNGNIAMPSGLLRFNTTGATDFTAAASASAAVGGGGWSLGNIEGGNSRWPRQETLTLLEIRSRLDSKFKEANQKGPLWDEVSRIMAEEYGYQRSGKKCREKFENLYKYYKKTKEGKAGRQDGKNYRFFKQLEAIYGETSNQSSVPETNNINTVPSNPPEKYHESMQEQKMSESLGFSDPEFEASSSEKMNDDECELSGIASMVNQKGVKKGWKTKVKDLVDSQMKRLIYSQDVWMERMLKVIEEKEKERVLREEEWRRQEAARFDKEHELWVKERAWIEARDASVMAALKTLRPLTAKSQNEINANRWTEHEILERRLQENGYSTRQSTWEDIEAKMVKLGYDYEHEANNAECYKKRKEDYLGS